MDLIQMTRELGAAIQQDARYLKFMQAHEANEKDNALNELIGKIQLVHMNYNHEAAKEDKDEESSGELPPLVEQEVLDLQQAELLRKMTKAPALLTENTLLGMMETAGKELEDEGGRVRHPGNTRQYHRSVAQPEIHRPFGQTVAADREGIGPV